MNTIDKEVVDPALYSKDYFLTDNEGWREYANGLDSAIHPKYARALELAAVSDKDIVLDVGCGRGELVYYCAARGARALGIDYSPAAVEIARETISRLSPELRRNASADVGDPSSYPFRDRYTIVFMIETVEHMHDWQLEEAFDNIYRIIADAGRLITITPNYYYERYLSPIKRLVNVPINLVKLPFRLFKPKYRKGGLGGLLHKTLHIRVDRGELNRAMHVNVMTPARMRKLLHRFEAKVWCEDSSKNLLSLITMRWWGRDIIAVAGKRRGG